jgi:hypothetical protein
LLRSVPVVATGAVDKTLKITNYETGDVVCQVKDVFNGAIVTMDIQKTNPCVPKPTTAILAFIHTELPPFCYLF